MTFCDSKKKGEYCHVSFCKLLFIEYVINSKNIDGVSTGNSRVINSKTVKCRGVGCTFKPTKDTPKFNWLFVKTQDPQHFR